MRKSLNSTDSTKPAHFDYAEFEAKAIEALKAGQPLTGKDDVVTPLLKRILEDSLEGELETPPEQTDEPNRRNGKCAETMRSTHGPFELVTPRDREDSAAGRQEVPDGAQQVGGPEDPGAVWHGLKPCGHLHSSS